MTAKKNVSSPQNDHLCGGANGKPNWTEGMSIKNQ